jgi:cyclase
MHRTLIVAKMDPDDAGAVAQVFAESDATGLPEIIGVTRRTLFQFHDLYFHLVEAEQDISARLDEARDHPLYVDVSSKLARYMKPYGPWQTPKDSFARPFYVWSPK